MTSRPRSFVRTLYIANRTLPSASVGGAGTSPALHPESTRVINVYMDWDDENAITWTADAATTDLQDIPGVAGLSGERLHIENWTDGEYLGILEASTFGDAEVL